MASKQEIPDQSSKNDSEQGPEVSTSKTVLDEAVDALEFIPGRPMIPNSR